MPENGQSHEDEAIIETLQESMRTHISDSYVTVHSTDRELTNRLIEEITPIALVLYKSARNFSVQEEKARQMAVQQFEAGETTKALEAANLSVFFGKQKFAQQFILRELGADPSEDPYSSSRSFESVENLCTTLKNCPFLLEPRFTLIQIAKDAGEDDSTYRDLLIGLYGGF